MVLRSGAVTSQSGKVGKLGHDRGSEALPLAQSTVSPALVLLALVAVQILFGLGYPVSKILVGNFPPLVWAAIRIVIAAVLMVTTALVLRRPHPKMERQFFIPLIGLALLGMIINQSSFLLGLHYTTATNSAILNTLIPIFSLLIVTLRGEESLRWRSSLGFVLSLAGVLALRKIEQFSLSDQTWVGDLLTVANCLSYAIFLSVSKPFLARYDRFWVTAWLFIYGSVGIGLISIPQWQGFHWPVITPGLAWCMVFAVIGTTLLTYFLNLWALNHAKSHQVALFIYVQPVVASAAAWFWLNEMITVRTVLSSLLIFLGIVLARGK